MLNRFRFEMKGYASSITADNSNNGGFVSNADNIKGEQVDKKYALFYSGSGKAALNVAMTNMNNPGASLSGYVFLRGYTPSGYNNNHLLVFVSNDNYNWWTIIDCRFYTNGSGGVTDISCGYVSNFKYLSIVVYTDGYVGDVYLDKAHVF